MKYIRILFILSTLTYSCKSDNQSVDELYSCITTTQRTALQELGSVCDKFIKYNYPNMTLDAGYRHFLKDLENERDTWSTDDSVAVMKVNRMLKAAFGEGYNSDKAYFTSISTLTTCLEKASNNRFIDDFVKLNIDSGGG